MNTNTSLFHTNLDKTNNIQSDHQQTEAIVSVVKLVARVRIFTALHFKCWSCNIFHICSCMLCFCIYALVHSIPFQICNLLLWSCFYQNPGVEASIGSWSASLFLFLLVCIVVDGMKKKTAFELVEVVAWLFVWVVWHRWRMGIHCYFTSVVCMLHCSSFGAWKFEVPAW